MPSIGIANSYYPYANYTDNASKGSRSQNRTNANSLGAAQTDSKIKMRSESAVRQFINRHPNHKHNVDKQVRAGRSFLIKNNADTVDRESMTMEEYKQFFTSLMDNIPFDSSQKDDVEIWSITEKGWEQMKNDPEYEAWVLGYTVLDRAVHFPFAYMPGYSPNYHTEHFGASIEEHIGQSVPMNSPKEKTTSDSDDESWWIKRHKRIKQLLAENAEIARQRDKANQEILQEEWMRSKGASLTSMNSFSTLAIHQGLLGSHKNTSI